ncbi:MAG TPA: hypothetical protein VMF88_00830 [Bacteroidota bacterium]|nr:hypothetical protein [Bacteroidota bacterium]
MEKPITPMKCCSFFVSLLLAFAGLGCLASEITEYKITMNDDGKSGTIVSTMRNVQSDESDQTKQSKDFDEAIRSWKGDDYLLERMHDGLYVKERSLAIEDSVLVWTEKAIFANLDDVFKHEFHNDTLRFVIKGDQSLVATNGVVIPGKDSTVVYWNTLTTKEILLTTRENNFAPKSDFAARFKAYLHQKN